MPFNVGERLNGEISIKMQKLIIGIIVLGIALIPVPRLANNPSHADVATAIGLWSAMSALGFLLNNTIKNGEDYD
jgi:hypothetical protein